MRCSAGYVFLEENACGRGVCQIGMLPVWVALDETVGRKGVALARSVDSVE